ncbi:MAG: hypothetical protein IKA76_09190 [Clostridia bacterium]|nr:hypothetical protein [Clostridia bacterium]
MTKVTFLRILLCLLALTILLGACTQAPEGTGDDTSSAQPSDSTPVDTNPVDSDQPLGTETDSSVTTDSSATTDPSVPSDSAAGTEPSVNTESSTTPGTSASTESSGTADSNVTTDAPASSEAEGGATSETESSSTPPSQEEPEPVVKDFAYYDKLNKRDEVLAPLKNDYRSRTQVTYPNINGRDVTVYTLYREPNEGMNSPNFAQAVMLWQCIQYKKAHPEADVKAGLATFHLSVHAAACLDVTSSEYGRMENLYDCEYNQRGYYRLVWLLTEAARYGIEVLVIGDMDANPTHMSNGSAVQDRDFLKYFEEVLESDTYIEGKKIGDFLTVRRADWTAYGDKAATDMMHLKTCYVSHYVDNNGVEAGPAFWLGSINVDGVNDLGYNEHNSIQSGVVITGHDELYRLTRNYMMLLKDYCHQEGAVPFRSIVIERTTEQVALIRAGKESQIPVDEQIVYMGRATDSVFEYYFTPLGGGQNQWDTDYNPFCRYIGKLANRISGKDSIQFIWNNVKFVQSYGLADTFAKTIAKAFTENTNPENILALNLPGLNLDDFATVPLTEHIRLNNYWRNYHIKDMMVAYTEKGERNWVVVYNTLNMHEGSMGYQVNQILVVKETENTGNNFYTDYAIMTTPGADYEQYRVQAAQ